MSWLTPAAFGGLHLGEFSPPLIAMIAYLCLYARRAERHHLRRRLARGRLCATEQKSRPSTVRSSCQEIVVPEGRNPGG